MPVYDYVCPNCGPFTEVRAMARFEEPCDCPDCSTSSDRAFLTVPAILGMEASQRTAHSVNERSRHEPARSTAFESGSKKHAPGCGCCSTKKTSGVFRADGAKAFPSTRPWMISH